MSATGTQTADFGSPVTATSYRLCVYDTAAGSPSLKLSATAPAGGTCAGRPCWSENAEGFKYTNKALTPNGLLKVVLKASASGAAKISVKGKGGNLALPPLPLTPPVRAQLQATNGQCWDAVYSTPIVDDASLLKAKSD